MGFRHWGLTQGVLAMGAQGGGGSAGKPPPPPQATHCKWLSMRPHHGGLSPRGCPGSGR